MNPVPKPPKKTKKSKHISNSCPTVNDSCSVCGKPYAQTHEAFAGQGRRNLSIKYKMQKKLCDDCHRLVTSKDGHWLDMEIKQSCQKEFEQDHTRQEFIAVFGKNYL